MNKLTRAFNDLLCLFYPHLCLACGENAPTYGEDLCLSCRVTMPEPDYHLRRDNPFTERFWGRVNIESGAAMYLFTKESKVQHLLHNLKYLGKKEIGETVGRRFGYKLKDSPLFQNIDLIVPVPLHPLKELDRGYNQSEMFARGLSESMALPYLKDGLKRLEHSSSQTKKSKMERVENVKEVFAVKKPEALEGKHILIVDDVLTTGSTLESCAEKVLALPGTKVSMATIAIATH